MAFQEKNVYNVPGEKPSSDIGVFIKRGGILLAGSINLLDEYIYAPGGSMFNNNANQQFFKFIHVQSGGNLVYETPEKRIDVFYGVPDGGLLPIHGARILSAATIDAYDGAGTIIASESVSTTCTGITWHGGE